MNDYEFAIQMELAGEKYYREQAEKNRNQALYPVCTSMADNEMDHAQAIRNRISQKAADYSSMKSMAQARNVFHGLADMKVPGKELLDQFDFYRKAVAIEQKSIALYTEYLAKAEDDPERDFLRFLLNQEKEHFDLMDGLATMIRHTMEQWESAEFGLRPEY